MTHPDDLLASAVSGSMTREERANLDEHLTGCERCRSQLVVALSARGALRDLPAVEPPPGLSDRIDAAVSSSRSRPASRKAPVGWSRAVAGLAAAALIALAVLALPHLGGSGGSKATTAAIAEGGSRGVIFMQTSQNYDATSIRQLAESPFPRSNGAPLNGPSPTRIGVSPQVGTSGASVAQPASDVALVCLEKGSVPSRDAQLTQIIQARYLGRPAYIGVYLIGSPPTQAQVWVVHADTCGVFATANLTLHP